MWQEEDEPQSISQLFEYLKEAESVAGNSLSFDNEIYARYFEGRSSESVSIGYFVNAKNCSGSSCEHEIKFKRELILTREKLPPYRSHLAVNPQYEGSLAAILGYEHDEIRHKLVKVDRTMIRNLLEEAVHDGFLSVALRE